MKSDVKDQFYLIPERPDQPRQISAEPDLCCVVTRRLVEY